MRCCSLPLAPSRKGRGRIGSIPGALGFCLEIPASSSARPYEGPAHTSLHVVSLNLCTDQMLVLLAPEKIAALSTLARDPSLSYVAPQAVQLPIVRASAEAVLRLRPDLVVAAPYGAQTTLALLQQERVPSPARLPCRTILPASAR